MGKIQEMYARCVPGKIRPEALCGGGRAFLHFIAGYYAVLPNLPTRGICFFVKKHEKIFPFSGTIANRYEKC